MDQNKHELEIDLAVRSKKNVFLLIGAGGDLTDSIGEIVPKVTGNDLVITASRCRRLRPGQSFGRQAVIKVFSKIKPDAQVMITIDRETGMMEVHPVSGGIRETLQLSIELVNLNRRPR